MRIKFLIVCLLITGSLFSQNIQKFRVIEESLMKDLKDRPTAKWFAQNILITLDSVTSKIVVFAKVREDWTITEYEGEEQVKTGVFYAFKVKDKNGVKARFLWYVIAKPVNDQVGTIFIEYETKVVGYRYKHEN